MARSGHLYNTAILDENVVTALRKDRLATTPMARANFARPQGIVRKLLYQKPLRKGRGKFR